MTLLLCDQYEDSAILVTDTLQLHGHNDQPSGFRSKVWALPHMNMAIAMTGTANIGDIWCNHITTAAGVTNIEELDAIASESLRRIHAEVEEHYGPTGRSTVYHFGFPPDSDKLVRYTYRSKNNWEPEVFTGYQFLAKPAPEGFDLKQPNDAAEMIQLATHLRETCRMPNSGALMVGGELFATRITSWSIQTMRWHRFDDYDETLAAMRRN